MLESLCSVCGSRKSKCVKVGQIGGAIDVHSLIGKFSHPETGFTPGNYRYMGPYNTLEKQLEYDKNTSEVTKWHVQPCNKVDEIAAYHDICYDMGKTKENVIGKWLNFLIKSFMEKCRNGAKLHDSLLTQNKT